MMKKKTIQDLLKPVYIRHNVEGAPCLVGEVVRVMGPCDEVGEECGIGELTGKLGLVKYFEYECGSGQHYPDDPMVGVRFSSGEVRELWKDEFVSVRQPSLG